MFREGGMFAGASAGYVFAMGAFALSSVAAREAPASHDSSPVACANLKTAQREGNLQIQEQAFTDGIDGALRPAVARRVEGVADSDGAGVRVVKKRWSYVPSIVRRQSGFHGARGLLAVGANDAMVEPHSAQHDDAHPGLPEFGAVTLFNSATVEHAPPSGATLIEDKSKAELVYDVNEKRVLDSTGNVLAFDVDPADIENIVRTRQLLKAIEALAKREGVLDVSLSAVDRLYVKGARVIMQVDGEPYNFLTVFDVTANGRMTLLYPLVDAPFRDSLETHSSR